MPPKSKANDSVLGDGDIIQVDEYDDEDPGARSTDEERVCSGHMILMPGISRPMFDGFEKLQGVKDVKTHEELAMMTVKRNDPIAQVACEKFLLRLAQLGSHPNIASLFHPYMDGPELQVVTRGLSSQTLDEAMLKDGDLNTGMPVPALMRKVDCAIQMCLGLLWAHEHNIPHLMLRPACINVEPERDAEGVMWLRVKITSFGVLCRTVLEVDAVQDYVEAFENGEEEEEEEHDWEEDGPPLGVPEYRAPEQAQELAPAIGKNTDQWSFGCIMLEMFLKEREWETGDAAGRTCRTPDTLTFFAQMWGVGRDLQKLLQDLLVPRPAGRLDGFHVAIANFVTAFEKLANKPYHRPHDTLARARQAVNSTVSTQTMLGFWYYHMRHKYEMATACFEEALDSRPRDPVVLRSFGIMLDSVLDKPERAQEMYERLLEVEPEHIEILYRYGCLLTKSFGDAEKSEEMLRRLLVHEPRHRKALTALGVLLHHSRQELPGAAKQYSLALEVQPDHFHTLFNYALLCHFKTEDYTKAVELYTRALAVRPRSLAAATNLADIQYHIRHDIAAAAELYRRALDIDPDHVDSLCHYGHMLCNVFAQVPDAERLFEHALSIDARHLPTLINYGFLCHSWTKNYEKAEELYFRAYAIAPENLEVLVNLSIFMYDAKQDHDESQRLENIASGIFPHHPHLHKLFGGALRESSFDPGRIVCDNNYKALEEVHLPGPDVLGFTKVTIIQARTTGHMSGMVWPQAVEAEEFDEYVSQAEDDAIDDLLAIGSHPNIAGMLEAHVEGIRPMIILNCVNDGTLRELMHSNLHKGTVSSYMSRIIDITIQVCLAVDWMHKRGFTHENVRPENIVVVGGIGDEGAKFKTIRLANLLPNCTWMVVRALHVSEKNSTEVRDQRAYRSPEQASVMGDSAIVEAAMAAQKEAARQARRRAKNLEHDSDTDSSEEEEDKQEEVEQWRKRRGGTVLGGQQAMMMETFPVEQPTDLYSIGVVLFEMMMKSRDKWDRGEECAMLMDDPEVRTAIGKYGLAVQDIMGVLIQLMQSNPIARPKLKDICGDLKELFQRTTGTRYVRAIDESAEQAIEERSAQRCALLRATWLDSKHRDYEGAKIKYEEALKLDPYNRQTLFQFATMLHRKLNLNEEAALIYERMLVEDPMHVEALLGYGALKFEHHGLIDEAEELYLRALAIDPTHLDGTFQYALLWRARKNADKALDLYTAVLRKDPRDVRGLMKFGKYAHYMLLQHDTASAFFQRVIYVDKWHAGAWLHLAHIRYTIDGDVDGAELAFQTVIAIKPLHLRGLTWYAIFLHNARDAIDEAHHLFKKARRCHKAETNVFLMVTYGYFLHKKRKDYDGAKALYEEALAVDPCYVPALVNLHHLEYDAWRHAARADELWARVLAIDQHNVGGLTGGPITDLDRTHYMYTRRGYASRFLL